MSAFIIWLIVVELLGLAAFPLAATLFPRFVDRGYGLGKTLAILLVTWLNWLLGESLGAGNLVPILWLLVIMIGAAGVWALVRRGEDLHALGRGLTRIILIEEAIFVVAFAVWTLVRANYPDIYGTEKPMDLMYLTTAMEHHRFAPPDLWLSSATVNYYYVGYLAMATIATLTGIAPTIGFNLALALVFALTITAAFSIGLTLARSYLGAALSAIFVGLLGNLDGLWQALGNVLGPTPNWSGFNWCASRVIGGCQNYTTINEFPFFSFVLGDLHPHVITLPFALLCVALALNVILSAADRLSANTWAAFGSTETSWLTLGIIAVAAGSLYAMNSWDLPAYLLLIVAGLVIGPVTRGVPLLASLRRALVPAGTVIALSIILWLPFWVSYHSSAQGIGFKIASTDPGQYLTVNGLSLAPLLILLTIVSWPSIRAMAGRVFGARYAATAASPGGSDDLPRLPLGPVQIVLGVMVVALVIVLHIRVALIALIILAVALRALLGSSSRDDPEAAFVWLAVTIAMGLTILCEFVYLRDIFDNGPYYRMNTVFKFYYEIWILLGIGAGWAVVRLRALAMARRGRMAAWLALLVLILGSGGTYTLLALPNNGISRGAVPTLDGTAYLARLSPGDAEAIGWLRAHAPLDAVVAEAVGGDYWSGPPDPPPYRPGQVATYTGRPTLIEAAGSHEGLWHPNSPLITAHEAAATAIYGPDPAAAQQAIVREHVRYVYVGPQEAQTYAGGNPNAPALTKFGRFLRTVYQKDGVTIYAV